MFPNARMNPAQFTGIPVAAPMADTYRNNKRWYRWSIAACLLAIVSPERLVLGQTPALPLQPVFQPIATRTSLPIVKAAATRTEWADAGDTYLGTGNQEIRLLRATNEFGLILAPGVDTATVLARAVGVSPRTAPASREFAVLGSGTRMALVRTPGLEAGFDINAMRQTAGVLSVRPVLADPATKNRLIPTGELLIALKPGLSPVDVESDAAFPHVESFERAGSSRLGAYLVRFKSPPPDDLALARELARHPKIAWAVPNFARELELNFAPNDPLFSQQQHLQNVGYQGGKAGADISAPAAWDISPGVPSIVIAILDDGVDTDHPDLAFYTNPGESGGGKETNTTDDDTNGYVDDVRGWDFVDDDNNPKPDEGGGAHGTACAGLAAGRIHNSLFATGVAGNCRILPLRMLDATGATTTDARIGEAIGYAADHADVISCSWTGGSPSPFIDAALLDAATNGRGGRGCPVIFGTGNSASGWRSISVPIGKDLLGGTFAFGFRFNKDGDDANGAGENLIRIDNVVIVDADEKVQVPSALGSAGRQDFEAAFPPIGWTLHSSHGSDWNVSTNGALRGSGGTRSARSGSITHNQWTELRTPNLTFDGNDVLLARVYISSEAGTDGLLLHVYRSDGAELGHYDLLSGIPSIATAIAYPATHPNVIATGASTDADVRADYSQFGPQIDLVAPSSGGWNALTTLDVLGTGGFSLNDTTSSFGGTSAAASITAGVAALVLSVNPALSAVQVRDVLRGTADKIGTVAYVNGFNNEYGYGRINARAALEQTAPPIVSVLASDNVSAEPANAGRFTFNRTGSTVTTLTVRFSLSGSGTSGSDFQPLGNSVTFNVGSDTATLLVDAINDTVPEPPETLVLTITPDPAYTVGTPASATMRLLDDDPPQITVTFRDNVAAEPGNSGIYLLNRLGPTNSSLTVNFTLGGTATAGVDYQTIATNVSINSGASNATVTVTPINDTIPEATETVILTLAPGTGYTIGTPASATMPLLDNDPPVVSISASDPDAGEPSNNGSFTLSRVGPLASPLTVQFAASGTASSGADYSPFGTAATFPAGVATTNIIVALINDGLVEGSETVIVTLTASDNYTLGVPSSATVTLTDDDAPRISVVASDNTAAEPGSNTGRFTFSRAGSSVPPITVNLAWSGTAISGADYSPAAPTVFLGTGVTTAHLTLTPLNDGISEPEKTVTVTINPGSDYNVDIASSATVFLYDDDASNPSPGVLQLDGLNDFATADISIWPNDNGLVSYTVEAWVRPRLTTGLRFVAADDAYDFDFTAAALDHVLYDPEGRFSPLTAPGAPTANAWTHVAILFDGVSRQLRVARDGLLSNPLVFPSTQFFSDPSQQFTLGARRLGLKSPPEGLFDGQIDEVRISDVVRYTRNFAPPTRFDTDDSTRALYHFDEPAGATTFADASGRGVALRGLGGAQVLGVTGPEALDGAPVGYWKFNENFGTTAADASRHANQGTLAGAPQWNVAGRAGGALRFDGFDDTVVIPDAPELRLGESNSDFSVALWVNLQAPPSGQWRTLLHKGNASTARTPSLFLWPATNRIHYRVSTTGNWNQGGDSVGLLPLNTWTHLAMVKRGAALQLYLNGALDSQITVSSPVVHNTSPLYIGDDPGFSAPNAMLDEVRLYRRALNESEVFGLAHLVGHWRFAEGSGGTTEDSSPYQNVARLGVGSLMPSWVINGVNNALRFDGTNDVLTIPDDPILQVGANNSDFSVALWVRLQQSASGVWRTLFHKGNGNTARTPALFLKPNTDQIHYRVSTPLDWNQGGDSVGSLPLNTWTHVALIKSGLNLRLYFNGALDSQVTLPAGTVANNQPIYLGDNPWFSGFGGTLDDLRIYRAALPNSLLSELAATPLHRLESTPALRPQPPSPPSPQEESVTSRFLTRAAEESSPSLSARLLNDQLIVQLHLPASADSGRWSLALSHDLVHWQTLDDSGAARLTDESGGVIEWRVPTQSPANAFLRAYSISP